MSINANVFRWALLLALPLSWAACTPTTVPPDATGTDGAAAGTGDSAGTGGDGGAGGSATATTFDVSIRNFAFDPPSVTVRKGDTVRWTNRDSVTHTVTSGNPGEADAGSAFNGTLAAGGVFSRAFDAEGEFSYFCVPHSSLPSMRGAKVTVTP